MGIKCDMFLQGAHLLPLVLKFGQISAMDIFSRKYLNAMRDIDIARTKNYGAFPYEIVFLFTGILPIYFMLGRESMCMDILEVWGLPSDGNIMRIQAVLRKLGKNWHNLPTACQLYLGCIDPNIVIDGVKFDAWIPAPTALAELGKDHICRSVGLIEVLSSGCRAYLRVGRDDDAVQLARIALSPDQHTIKTSERMSCHSVLGQVAAKRGNLDEANGHFADAFEVSKQSGLPMFEVLVARDWKKHLLEPHGRDCSVAEAAIDAACAEMKKTRAELASVLL